MTPHLEVNRLMPFYIYAGLPLHLQKSFRYDYLYSDMDKVAEIAKIVFNHFNVDLREVTSSTHEARSVKPRQIAMYFIRTHLKTPLKTIGKFFGNRDHSTVIYACDCVRGQIQVNKGYAAMINELEKLI